MGGGLNSTAIGSQEEEEAGNQIATDPAEILPQPDAQDLRGSEAEPRQSQSSVDGAGEVLEWDHTSDLDTPTKIEDDFLDLGDDSFDSFEDATNISIDERRCEQHYPHTVRPWSVSVNRLDIGEISPERLPRNYRRQRESSNLEPIEELHTLSETEDNLDYLAQLPQNNPEESVFEEDLQEEEQEQERIVVVPGEMDEQTYYTRCRVLKDNLRKIEESIEDFTEEDVFEATDEVAEPLQALKTQVENFSNQVRGLYDEFDRNAHEDWEIEWETRLKNLRDKHKKNERDVKRKLTALKSVLRENIATVAANDDAKARRENEIIVAKANVKRIDILENLRDLGNSIKKASDTSKMEDHEIIRFLLGARTWDEEFKNISKKVLGLKELVVMHPMETGDKKDMEDKYDSVKADLEAVVKLLEKEDHERESVSYTHLTLPTKRIV